jgi:hypothetical protein
VTFTEQRELSRLADEPVRREHPIARARDDQCAPARSLSVQAIAALKVCSPPAS